MDSIHCHGNFCTHCGMMMYGRRVRMLYFLFAIMLQTLSAKNCPQSNHYNGLRERDLPARVEIAKPYTIPVCFDRNDQIVFENNPSPCGGCCGFGGGNSVLYNPQTIALSPGAAGAPSPCGQACFVPTPSNTRVRKYFYNADSGKNETVYANQLLSPLIFQPTVQYMMDFLRRFYWIVTCPQYNWFYDPNVQFGETPCSQFKQAYSGIDVTLYRPDSSEPICSTTKLTQEFNIFATANANACCNIREENYLETSRRVAYAVNIVNSCGQMRTVVLSKAKDEFPPGYVCRLVNNPCNPYVCGH